MTWFSKKDEVQKQKEQEEKIIRKQIMECISLGIKGKLTKKKLDDVKNNYKKHHDKYNDWTNDNMKRLENINKLEIYCKD